MSKACDNCDVITINGVVCHERSCPDAWMDESRTCDWCGTIFVADERRQRFCDESCAESYNT